MGELFVYSVFLGVFFFLFPIFVYVDGYLDVKENKLWFSVSLFKFFRVFGGYMELRREGIVFHLTRKKAIILPYRELAPMRKRFEITKGFQLYRFHQIIETGGLGQPSGLLFAALVQTLGGQIFSFLQTEHPFLSLKNSTLLTERSDLKLSVQAATIFNGLILTVAITKKGLEAIINWSKEKKSTVFWKKQRSS